MAQLIHFKSHILSKLQLRPPLRSTIPTKRLTTMAAPTKKEVLDDVQKSWQDKSIAEKYARSEKATKPFGELMVNKAGFDKLEGDAHIFDLACGTGAVEAALYEVLPKEKWGSTKVLGGDISESMLDYLKERADNEGWTGVETQVIDATVSSPWSSTLFIHPALILTKLDLEYPTPKGHLHSPLHQLRHLLAPSYYNPHLRLSPPARRLHRREHLGLLPMVRPRRPRCVQPARRHPPHHAALRRHQKQAPKRQPLERTALHG